MASPVPVTAELAEAVAARAMLADFQQTVHEFTVGTVHGVDWLTWALRMSQHMQQLLDAAARMAGEPQPAAGSTGHAATGLAPGGGAWLTPADLYVALAALRDAAEFTDPAMAARYAMLAGQLGGNR
jgi:hypothetical protein